ncbi:MAG: serine hydrolase [Rubrobacteraceae bacterium]
MLLLAFLFLLAFLVLLSNTGEPESVSRLQSPATGSQPTVPLPGGDLEEELSEMALVYPGVYGITVFDSRSGEVAAVNAGRAFDAASLAKLPVLLTLYKEAARGRIDLDEEISILPSDRTPEGSGPLYDYPVGHEMTLRDCARLLIKDSDNTAWIMLERRLGTRAVHAELDALGIDAAGYDTRSTTPEEVMLMLRAIADPGYTNPSLSSEMLDTMTGTSFEGRIPESLPESVRVAHKIGNFQDTYSDAGVVFERGASEPDDGYYIVIMSQGASQAAAKEAMREMSLLTYETLRPGSRQ